MSMPSREDETRRGRGRGIKARRRSALRALRLFLPIILLLAATLLFLATSGDRSAILRSPLSFIELADVSLLPRLVNLRIKGEDHGGRPYSLSADDAREVNGTKTIHLSGLRARLEQGNGGWIKAEAEEAIFDRGEARLFARSSLAVQTSDGYRLKGSDVVLHLDSGRIESERSVSAEGPLGDFHAGGVDIRDSGKKMRFAGPVRMLLRLPPPQKRASEGKP